MRIALKSVTSQTANSRSMTETAFRHTYISLWGRCVKRLADIIFSLLGLLLASPLFLMISYALWRKKSGSIFFRQERVGYRGRTFVIYKFRTMVSDAESGKPRLCEKDDTRLTPLGAWLRQRHLDELPQLWNVLKGDMSIVGPRPERRYFVDQIRAVNPDYDQLYQLRPGLFSWATLYNGYTDTLDKMLERLRLDLDYLHHWSPWLDLKIFVLTLWFLFSGRRF